MKRLSVLALLGTVLGLATAPDPSCQTTYVVDINGGPGSHFTSIGAALAAAVDGDTIIVLAGSYGEFFLSTSKGVRLVGEPGASLGIFNFTISGVQAGKTMVFRGFTFTLAGVLTVADNLGQVHLEDLDLSPFILNDSGVFTISNSAQVTVTQLSVVGYQPNSVSGSRVVLADCTIRNVHRGGFPNVALALDNSRVFIVGGTVLGGVGFGGMSSPAVRMQGGNLTLAGATTRVAAGGAGAALPQPAIVNLGGTIEWEPAVTVTPFGGSPPISGGPVTQRRIPSVLADGLANNGVWMIDMHAPQGSPFCLFTSVPIPALPSPFGELWFDPRFHALLGCSVVGPSELVSLQIPVRGLPRGAALVVQGGVAHSSIIELTTPVVSTVE